MSYYKPNYSSSFTPRSRGSRYSPRGSYRGSNRGGSRGGTNHYSPRSSFHSSRPSQDDYRRSFNSSRDSYQSRDYDSPARKRMRNEEPSNYGGYGSNHYDSYSERRNYSDDHQRRGGPARGRSEFRPPRGAGGHRGRLLVTRLSRSLKPRGRHAESASYPVRKHAYQSSRPRNLEISSRRSFPNRTIKRSAPPRESPKPPKDAEAKDEEADGDKPRSGYIQLMCPVCNLKSATFRRYEIHLSGRTHGLNMRRLALKQKSILVQMRRAQRATQKELDKTGDPLSEEKNFCSLCTLNYSQEKAVHEESEGHKNMKKVLHPHCKICNMQFKGPMAYENHCCTINHIKRKQKHAEGDADGEGSGDEDLANFTTIDSVGEGEDTKDKKEEESADLGEDQVKKIEAHYCDLCKMYLSRGSDSEMQQIIKKHCQLRTHRQKYARFKIAERKKEAEAEAEKETELTKQESEDKIWEVVDNELGDILAEAENDNKSSDGEEESNVNGQRYDRFKQSEESGTDDVKKEDTPSETDKETAADDA